MYSFLKSFDTVLSLNYDLLVYWTMTHGLTIDDGHAFKDCFSLGGRFDDNWRKYRNLYRYAEHSRTLVFYPHGSLALCRDRVEQEFKIHAAEEGLLESILAGWQGEQIVPLFVSEGIAAQKVASIQSSNYLSTVYREVLTSKRHTLTLFGWGIGEHDRHLLRQMRGTGIERVAISVKDRDEAYCNHAYQAIQGELRSPWRKEPIPVDFFDCESPGCWIHPPQWWV